MASQIFIIIILFSFSVSALGMVRMFLHPIPQDMKKHNSKAVWGKASIHDTWSFGTLQPFPKFNKSIEKRSVKTFLFDLIDYVREIDHKETETGRIVNVSQKQTIKNGKAKLANVILENGK